MSRTTGLTAEERALKRAKEYTDLMWHIATFAIIIPMLWFIDLASGDGLNWAYWPTIGWGLAVAFHVASHVIDDSGTENRKYQQFLAEERAKSAGES